MQTPDQPSTGRRRPHKKSKTGCAECRRRRIKCDEKKPTCTACVRHDLPCVRPYTKVAIPCLTPSSDHSTIGSSASALQADEALFTSSLLVPNLIESDETPSPSAATFVIDDLALLHHLTLSASLDIVKSSGGDHYWQRVFPQIAFRHAFVMHGILSLAALHLAYRQPPDRQRLVCIAAYHHNIALQGFQQGISQMSDDNSDALFVCTSLNILYVFGNFGPLCDDLSVDRKSRILGAEWIPAIRGVEAVLQPVYERVRRGPLNLMLGLGNWEELDPNHQSVVGDAHFRSIQVVWHRSSNVHIYDKALYLLRKCNTYMRQFATMSSKVLAQWGYIQTWSAPFIWLHLVPEEYFELLQQRQPPALLIFAYLGTLFHALDDYWFMEGWGRDMVDVANELLGEYWCRWMAWPKDIVGIHP